MNQIQRVTTKALISQNGKIFFVKDERGNWEWPGGRINFGEHPKETLKREVGEELGLNKIKIGRIIDVFDFQSNRDNTDYHFIVLVYECEADLTNLRLSNEHSEYVWIDPDEIDQYPMRDGYKESVKRYLAS